MTKKLVSQIFLERSKWENNNEEDMRLYYRAEEKIYTTKRENLFLVPKMLKFIEKQLRKEYIRLLKLSRAVPVFL